MLVEITAKPVFWFNLTKDQIELLLKASAHHYDGVCQDASKVGGFLYGWKNSIEFSPGSLLSGSFKDVDTAIKILEMVQYIVPNEFMAGRQLANSLLKALQESNKYASKWRVYLEV